MQSVAKDIADRYFDAFGKGRLRILGVLIERPMSVTEIVKATGLGQTHVSHNLRMLSSLGFVEARAKGRVREYRVRKNVKPIIKENLRCVRAYMGYVKKAGISLRF